MTSYVFSVIRSLIPSLVLDDVFTSKNELGQEIEKQLKENFESFGLLIMSAPVTDMYVFISLPACVHDARQRETARGVL
jgi:regulator of protease activity HflC (stomatin/prohibitin superfamily)